MLQVKIALLKGMLKVDVPLLWLALPAHSVCVVVCSGRYDRVLVTFGPFVISDQDTGTVSGKSIRFSSLSIWTCVCNGYFKTLVTHV